MIIDELAMQLKKDCGADIYDYKSTWIKCYLNGNIDVYVMQAVDAKNFFITLTNVDDDAKTIELDYAFGDGCIEKKKAKSLVKCIKAGIQCVKNQWAKDDYPAGQANKKF